MRIEYKKMDNLPPMSWVAEVSDGATKVICGCKVEIKEEFFVEGAWGGRFRDGDFDMAEWSCCTGGRIRGNKIIFSTPTGMHAGLYLVKEDRKVTVSNSLPFIMAYKGFEYDPGYINYESFFNHNVLQGIHHYKPSVHALKVIEGKKVPNDSIKMVLFRNITVYENGRTLVEVKADTKGFDSFDEYYNRLVSTMKALTKNAQDSHRTVKYKVTSYISSGYDAATCAAVAKEAGAEKVMTFSAKGKYAEDSGVCAAKYLGYEKIIEQEADAYRWREDFPETQSMAGGDIGAEISFCSFEEDCVDHLVYSGENGDFVWSRDKIYQTVNDDMHIVWKNSEIGLWEAHIHQGYIPVPMTNFGIRHWTDLYRISNSDEMKPWSLGTEYDRPIPRRILEHKGLPRESFGMKKYGAGFFYAYDWKSRILSRMSPKSAKDFEKYVRENKNVAPFSAYVRFIWANKGIYWNTLMSKLRLGLLVKIPRDKIERRNGIPNPFTTRYLIPWAGQHMVAEYRRALEGK